MFSVQGSIFQHLQPIHIPFLFMLCLNLPHHHHQMAHHHPGLRLSPLFDMTKGEKRTKKKAADASTTKGAHLFWFLLIIVLFYLFCIVMLKTMFYDAFVFWTSAPICYAMIACICKFILNPYMKKLLLLLWNEWFICYVISRCVSH